jgi:hypothetical protein
MGTFEGCKVGDVADVRLDASISGVGRGFSIMNEHKGPLLSFAYHSDGEAKAAHDLIAKAIVGAAITQSPS